MLVRLWQLRGLERLYRSGFEGLLEALDVFEKKWLDGGEISAKLVGGFPLNTLMKHRPCDLDSHDIDRVFSIADYHNVKDGARDITHGLWHPLVPNPIQLLDPFPSAATRLGCLYASGRRR